MTRFALIPLAFFANACASAEEVQDLVEETTEEVREGIDSYDAETDRNARNRNKAALSYAEREFRNELAERDCDLVGAVQGNWRDRRFRLNMTVINTNADTIAKLEGALMVCVSSISCCRRRRRRSLFRRVRDESSLQRRYGRCLPFQR